MHHIRKALLFFILTQNLWAGSIPVDVYADHVHYDNRKQIGDYRGHVRIIQGIAILKAHRVKSYMKNNKLSKLVLFGQDNEAVHYDSHAANVAERFKAQAGKMIYYPDRHIVQLYQKAKIAHGKNTFHAETIRYNIKEKRVISDPHKKGRTVIDIASNTIKNIIDKEKHEHLKSRASR